MIYTHKASLKNTSNLHLLYSLGSKTKIPNHGITLVLGIKLTVDPHEDLCKGFSSLVTVTEVANSFFNCSCTIDISIDSFKIFKCFKFDACWLSMRAVMSGFNSIMVFRKSSKMVFVISFSPYDGISHPLMHGPSVSLAQSIFVFWKWTYQDELQTHEVEVQQRKHADG